MRNLCCLMLYMRDGQMRYLTGNVISMLLNFSEIEAFAGEILVLGEIYFLIIPYFVSTSDILSHLTPKSSIFIEDYLGNKCSRLA